MSQQSSDQRLQAALAQCASEPIHIPGLVQSHGALIAVESETLQVLYASDNTVEFLGHAPQDILGQPLKGLFDRTARHALANGMAPDALGQTTNDLGQITIAGQPLLVTASAAPRCTVFEFEPAPEPVASPPNYLRDLEFLTSQARESSDEAELFDNSVQLLQMLTGFDRVMIYEFDAENNGTVRAEAAVAGVERFLGLNFPSWDIPEQARTIMAKTPMRCIADVDAVPAALLAARGDLAPLDLTYAHLRGVSPIHLEYLRNMDTRASFTLNIVVDGRVWGMIAFHHMAPRCLDQRTRQMCRSFADFFELQISCLRHAERNARLLRAAELRRSITDSVSAEGAQSIFEAKLLGELSQMMRADGAALLFKGAVVTTGLVPPQPQIVALLARDALAQGVTASACLGREHPDWAALCGPEIAGLVVSKLPEDCVFAFFRAARESVVTWAGAPDKAEALEPGAARLRPRGSFAAYRQKVTGTSAPWELEQLRLAEDLWSMLVTAERDALIRKTSRHQSLLIDELNHRVRNILALIRSLSRQSMAQGGSIESYVAALEARIAAVAASHDLGAGKSDDSATVLQICALEAAPYNARGARVDIGGTDSGIRSDLAPIVALVIHELMTNAAKYGALSQDGGQVTIRLSRSDAGLRIDWQERGGPEVRPPARVGFGTTLIQTSVPFELDGTVALEHAADGLRATIDLPPSILVDKVPIAALDPLPVDAPEVQMAQAQCLLVEDNYVVSLDTARVLQAVGLKDIETARNVADALERIARQPPEIAVLDINLTAGQTSEPVARTLQERGIPFLFVTGYGDTQQLSAAFAGAVVLKKPLRAEELRLALARLSE